MSNPEYLTYLTACLKNNKLIRWPENITTLKLFIAPFRWYKDRGNEYEYYSMIQQAIDIWQTAAQGRLRFEIVNNLYQSQINIDWKRVERTSLGHCQFNFDASGRLFSAEISIGLSDGLIHQQYQDKNEVCHTIIHEIGHALGLNHSPYQDDIMYVPHQYGITSVSKRDMNTLKWLYSFPSGLTKEEILSYYKMPGAYDLDKMIYNLETGQNAAQETQKLAPQETKQLHSEQDTLAELNKFNLSIQHFSVSTETQEYFKKLKMNKNLNNKIDS